MSGGRAAVRPVSAWRFLRRNPDYVEAWRAVTAKLPSHPGGNLGVRAQTDEDLEAAAWGLLAWEDPLDEDGPASPFWAEAPMLDAEAAPQSVPPLAKVIGEAGARLAGLRLADGALVLKIERGEAAAQVRIGDAEAFDPAGGLVLRLAFGLELPVALARVRDLWAIVDAGGRKGGGPSPGPGRASSCSPSTAS